MAELVRGDITDRPWGQTLGALALRGLTGQLTVVADAKEYCIAFDRGAVVGASSPLGSDAAVRVAMTSNFVSSTQVADLVRRLATMPAGRDEVAALAELARLAPEQTQRLRRRLIAQRAARTFSIDRGPFIVDDHISVPVVPGSELDIRGVIYLGASSNLSEDRLDADLTQLGAWFQVKSEAIADLPQYGFTTAERPILNMLVGGADLAELEGAASALGLRVVHAIVYALVSCGACDTSATPRGAAVAVPRVPTLPDAAPPPPPPRTPTPASVRAPVDDGVVRSRAPSAPPPSGRGRTPTQPPPGTENFVRMKPQSNEPPTAAMSLAAPRPQRSSIPPPRVRERRDTVATVETEALIRDRLALLNRGVDHFVLLGVGQDASPEAVRAAFFALARKLHPDRLASLGIADDQRDAQRLFAEINAAFSVVNDPARRREYTQVLGRGGQAAVRADDAKADDLAMRILQAEEAFRRGEMALRRDQVPQALTEFTISVELQPAEPDYQAMLAWAKFAAASDKPQVAAATRTALLRAADASDAAARPTPTARFYLGRMERMLGREREALSHFQAVLAIKPGHADASSEVRILESRLKGRR